MTTLADDPDLKHLFKLLSMLPEPRRNVEFWAAIQSHFYGGPDAGPPSEVDYIYEKMSVLWQVIQDPTPQNVTYLTRYLLLFFSADDPELWKILNRVTNRIFSLPLAGRFWARDLSQTAWTLYVRYWSSGDQWKLNWQYEDNWSEWRDWRYHHPDE